VLACGQAKRSRSVVANGRNHVLTIYVAMREVHNDCDTVTLIWCVNGNAYLIVVIATPLDCNRAVRCRRQIAAVVRSPEGTLMDSTPPTRLWRQR